MYFSACEMKTLVRPPSPMFSKVPRHILDFLKEQVPNIVPQSRSELEFSIVWILDELLPDLKTTDFKYIPQGPKGPSSPLLDPSSIVTPPTTKAQNYIENQRNPRTRHPQASHTYKKAKSTLMFSHVHPSKDGAPLICQI